MLTSPWLIAARSVEGTRHVRDGVICQDAHRVETSGEVLVAAVADGAGSALHAAAGAGAAVDQGVNSLLQALVTTPLDRFDRAFFLGILNSVRERLSLEAFRIGASVDHLSCTLLLAVSGPGRTVAAQVGDGAVVCGPADKPGEIVALTRPDFGEYLNETVFVNSGNAPERLQFQEVEGPVDRLALVTDGLQAVCWDYARKAPFAPFFLHLFETLASLGPTEETLRCLDSFLRSERICGLTDDDKTLVLAVRPPGRDSAGPA